MVCTISPPPQAALFAGNLLFSGIDPGLLEGIGAEIEVLHYQPGDLIFQENDPGAAMYLVGSGQVRISKMGRGGQQETLSYIEPDSFFGEMALFDGQSRSAQATATEVTTLGRVDDRTFRRILEVAPSSLHMNFLHSVTDRLRRVNTHFISEVMRNERLSLVGSMANSIIHDLKNPICVIRCCTEMLAAKTSDPSCQQFTSIINKSLDGLTSMTQELLDFARGKSCVTMERMQISRIFEELDAQMMRLVPEHVHLVKDFRYHGEIVADCPRLVRALLNLVKNSIEAIPENGLLTLSTCEKEGRICLAVSDTGCGICPEVQAKIFEPFVTSGKANGTGLGMAIVKSVVEAHEGKITLSSREGEGTRIEISLPAAP